MGLKKKSNEVDEIEAILETPTDTDVYAEDITPHEEEHLNAESDSITEFENKINMIDVNKAVELVQNLFGLGAGFVMQSYKVKGSKCTVSVANSDFDITIIINDAPSYGLLTTD
jgi:predicted secreted Zn-dependent protease